MEYKDNITILNSIHSWYVYINFIFLLFTQIYSEDSSFFDQIANDIKAGAVNGEDLTRVRREEGGTTTSAFCYSMPSVVYSPSAGEMLWLTCGEQKKYILS